MSEQIVDLIEAVYPGPRGLPGVNAVNNDEAVASYIGSEGSGTASALAECWPRFSRRRFVVFGDSWTTPSGAAWTAAKINGGRHPQHLLPWQWQFDVGGHGRVRGRRLADRTTAPPPVPVVRRLDHALERQLMKGKKAMT